METSVMEFTRTNPQVEEVARLLEELQSMLDICGDQLPGLEFIFNSTSCRLSHHIVLWNWQVADDTKATAQERRRQWLEEALDLADDATAAIDYLLALHGTTWEEVWDEYERQCLATVWH